LYLEETIKSLLETGHLERTSHGIRLVRAADVIRLPASIQGILSARIDHLSPGNKELLQTAAIVGEPFTIRILSELLDLPPWQLVRELESLQEHGFIHLINRSPEHEYAFKHALIQEVAYASLPTHRRRELHSNVTHALEKLYPDNRSDYAD